MDCTAFRTQIQQAADLTRLSAHAREHAAGCEACRTLQKQLVRLEADLVRLPLKPANPAAKRNLLNQLNAVAMPAQAAETVSRPKRKSRRGLLVGLAASLAIGGGVWLLGGKPNAARAALPADPLLESVIQCNIALAKDSSSSANTKLESLRFLAKQLSDQMHVIAKVDNGENLKGLASLYGKIVERGLLVQAKEVNGERQTILRALEAELSKTAQDAQAKSQEVPPFAKVSFLKLAEAAKTGAERIRQLLAEQSL